MTDLTARFDLPLLQPGQAQKELYHNEALALIDIAVAASVASIGLNVPPATPALGACWVVGTVPTGAWTGSANAIAGWTAGGWRFVAPLAGMAVWSAADQVVARFSGAAWVIGDVAAFRVTIGGNQVVGGRGSAIASPAGGSVIDSPARAAITAILAAMRTHGLIDS